MEAADEVLLDRMGETSNCDLGGDSEWEGARWRNGDDVDESRCQKTRFPVTID